MFNHEKALQGEPIYWKGDKIYPSYFPGERQWQYLYGGPVRWTMDGYPLHGAGGNLSTDPPIKKVLLDLYHHPRHGYSALSHGDDVWQSEGRGYSFIKTIEVEI